MNNDIYAEYLVKCKKPGYTIPFYIGMVLLVIIGLAASLLNPFGFVVLLAAVGAGYFGGMWLKVEYEYVFVTNELAIDRILSQRSRKRVKKIELSKVDKIASMSSHEFDYAKGNSQVKTIDYSSKKADAKTYGIGYSEGGIKYVVIFEPNDNLLKCLKSAAPRKVMLENGITAR